MIRVGVVTNPLDPATWIEHETDDLIGLLQGLFPTWPETARIYDLEGVGDWTRAAGVFDPAALKSRDVTPHGLPDTPEGEASVARLSELRGPVLVTIPPGDPLTIILTVVAVAVGIAAAFLLIPHLPGAPTQASPNNSLAERTNTARLNGRWPDIFGTVDSTPDLMAVPYSEFIDNEEVENAYMAVGRGSYDILRVRDGDTSIASISGASAAIYGPYTSPNSGDAPQLQIGPVINQPVRSVDKLNEVNGQTLKPSNLNFIKGNNNIRFIYPDTIQTNDSSITLSDYFSALDSIEVTDADLSGDAGTAVTTTSARFLYGGIIEFQTIDPSTVFTVGQELTITNGGFAGPDGVGGVIYVDVTGTYEISGLTSTQATLTSPATTNPDWTTINSYPAHRTEYKSYNFSVPVVTTGLNLNGTYTVASSSSGSLVLNNPSLVNANWANINPLPGHATDYVSPSLSRNTESWVGPYIVNIDDANQVLANFVALQGLYTLGKKKGDQNPLSVSLVLEATPVNNNDAAIGPAETFNITLTGSRTEKSQVGASLWAAPTFSGRSSIRARRTTPTLHSEDYGAVVDEVKWKDAYGLAPVAQTEFGNLTTVQTRTVATPGALAVKSRKLNMRVTRRLPQRISGSTFGPDTATDSADDIIAAICLDPYIGRRSIQEVDFDSIYDTIAQVKNYFGTPLAGQFGYTFDDTDVSFEEIVTTIAQTVFCTPYRQGRVIRLAFERATEESSLIFNARNIIPGSQGRTIRFGPLDDHDGVELKYVDPIDGAPLTFPIPVDKSARSARKIETVGIRSYVLAYWQAWRTWNKVRFQNVSVELEATQEASLTLPKDRVLFSDLTRQDFLQGDVEGMTGLTLSLSSPAALDPAKTWTIFLQHIDETVEPITVTAGPDDYSVVLANAPRAALSIDLDNFARATYIIVPDDDVKTRAFLITERTPNSNFTETVRAVNYSFLYYQNDELVLWLGFDNGNFYDGGPYLRDGTGAGGATTATDAVRGVVYSGPGSGARITFPAFTTPDSYTKAVWVRRADLTTAGALLGNAHEIFGFAASAQYQAGHDGVAVSAAWPGDGAWHHAAVTYDLDDAVMALYLDGMIVDVAESVAARTIVQQVGLDGLVGLADDLRLWKRALSASEVRSVYLSTRQGYKPPSLLTTGTDRVLVDDGGHGFILE